MYIPYQQTISALRGTGRVLDDAGVAREQASERRSRSILAGKQLDIEAAKTRGEQGIGLMNAQNMNERLKQNTARTELERERVAASGKIAQEKAAKEARGEEEGTFGGFLAESLKSKGYTDDQIQQHIKEMTGKSPNASIILASPTQRKNLQTLGKLIIDDIHTYKPEKAKEHDEYKEMQDLVGKLDGLDENDPQSKNTIAATSAYAEKRGYVLKPYMANTGKTVTNKNGLMEEVVTPVKERKYAVLRKETVDELDAEYAKQKNTSINMQFQTQRGRAPQKGDRFRLKSGSDEVFDGKSWQTMIPNQ